MRYIELMELFNSKETWTWSKTEVEDQATAVIGKDTLKVSFLPSLESNQPTEVSFYVNGAVSVTHGGNEFRIFSTVIAIIKDYLSTNSVQSFTFSSYNGINSGDSSRTDLYKALAKRLAATLNYTVEITKPKFDTHFTFTKKGPAT